LRCARGTGAETHLSAGAFNDDKWHHLTGQREGDTVRVFVDGELIATGTRAGSAASGKSLVFGRHGNTYVSASLDEARFSTVARSFDWIKAEYDNQRDPAAFSYMERVYHYDTATDAGLQSGSGVWSTADANWSVDASGSDPLAPWLDSATAHFSASGISTVSVDSVDVFGISVTGSGYVIEDGAIALRRGGIAADESVSIGSALTLLEPQEWTAAAGKTLAVAGATALGGNALTLTGDGLVEVSTALSGTGSLVKSGEGTADIGAASTFTGGTSVEKGLLRLSVGGASGAVRGTLAVDAGTEVELAAANALGTGAGTKVNTLAVNGGLVNNTASGDNGWGLTVAMTGGELRSNGGMADPGTAQLYSLGGGSAVNTLAASSSALITGRVNLREGNADNRLPFTVADGAAEVDLLIDAVVTETGVRGISKAGLGVMELVAPNLYSGGTRISDGLLLVNNATGSATGSGVVELNGGTLGGTGVVAGAVSFTAQGGLIEPGNSMGTLTVGGLNMSSSGPAALRIEINGASDYDSLAVNGSVTLTGGVLTGVIGGTVLPTDLFFIVVNDGADAVVGTFDGIAQGGTVVIGSYAFTVSYTGDAATLSTSGGNDVVLYNAADSTTALPTWREFSFPGYTRSTTLTNFPVLIALQKGMEGFSYANFLSPNGDDLRFYSDQSKTLELNYEIDHWDTNGISHLWVQIPEFNAATTIWANWGDPVNNFKPLYTGDGSVWSEDFGAVWHMNEADIRGLHRQRQRRYRLQRAGGHCDAHRTRR
jgi:autotransporter-associated beta strand protein